MMHELAIWSGNKPVGVVGFDDVENRFSLSYHPEWRGNTGFPLSPRLVSQALGKPGASLEIRRFLENLLPEGQALDDAVGLHQLSKSNVFGLLRALGKESAGALMFLPRGVAPDQIAATKREVTFAELSARIRERDHLPFSVWDGKVRMSIAGYQDKISVLKEGGRLFLTEGRFASTHILKPAPRNPLLKHLVLNEFFCMSLARSAGLNVAGVELLRVPEPVLLVERFDRIVSEDRVDRRHIIDGCQALGLPPHYKYEKNFGNGDDVSHVRDGASLPRLFSLIDQCVDNKSAERLELLRWTLLQYACGNVDGHAKNISYFVDGDGLAMAPAYDVVAGELTDAWDHDVGMAIGDEFLFTKVRPFDWAEFGCQCGMPRKIIEREMIRMAGRLMTALDNFPIEDLVMYPEERRHIEEIATFIHGRANALQECAPLLREIDDELLSAPWSAGERPSPSPKGMKG